jgi:hypothetical protein
VVDVTSPVQFFLVAKIYCASACLLGNVELNSAMGFSTGKKLYEDVGS